MPKIPAYPLVRFLAVVLLLGGQAALARPPAEKPDNLLNDQFTLQAGLIASSDQTELRRDSTTGTIGTELDGEKDLGLPVHKLTGRGEVMIRMRERHRVRLANYFLPLDRHATTTLTNTVNFGDTTFNVGDTVASALKVRLFALTYSYSFIKNDRAEIGASLGLDVIGFEAAASVASRLRTERDERSSPAPLVGLGGTVRIAGRYYAEARGQYLKVHASNVTGRMTTLDANILYRLTPNITFGAGYDAYDVTIDAQQVGNSGHFSLRSSGPQAFVRVGF